MVLFSEFAAERHSADHPEPRDYPDCTACQQEVWEDAMDALSDLAGWLETHEPYWDVFHTDPVKGEERYNSFQQAIHDLQRMR